MSAETKTTKSRTKRSWTRITTKIGDIEQTFWPTPEGLHVRRKGSPNVRTRPWPEVLLALNGGRHEFDHDGRHYEVWREDDGIHIKRSDQEEHTVKWAQFIEFVDGQKLLPI